MLRQDEDNIRPLEAQAEDLLDNLFEPPCNGNRRRSSIFFADKTKYPLVLIVDDDQMNIEVIKAMLEDQDVVTDTALSGNAALALVEKRLEAVYRGEAPMYKLILLDYSMPEMDGPQVAVAIRSLFRTSILVTEIDTPYICCCTAYGEAAFKKKALSAGMDNFLTKPISHAELQKLLSMLNESSKPRSN